MKLIIILILVMMAGALSAEIQTDKVFHFTCSLGMYIFFDCLAEWCNISPVVPFLIVGIAAFGKELGDPFFNWKDIGWDCGGIVVGVSIRLADKSSRR